MRKSVIVCLLMLAAFSTERASAMSYQNGCCNLCGIGEASGEFTVGYRTDDFTWKFTDPRLESFDGFISEIAGFGGDVIGGLDSVFEGAQCLANGLTGFDNKYKSEWKHMRMVNLGLNGRIDTCCCLYLKGSANYGWVCQGTYDPRGTFFGDAQFYEDLFSTQGVATPARKKAKGHTWDITGGLGYNFKWLCDRLEFAPLVGWSYHYFDFHTPKYKAIMEFEADVNESGGSFLSLDEAFTFNWGGYSKADYDARWNGPWVGFDAYYHYDCNWTLFCNFEYHYARHTGHGTVNTIDEIVSGHIAEEGEVVEDFAAIGFVYDSKTKFRNRICLRGVNIGGGIHYDVNDCYYFGFKVDYLNFRKAQNGSTRVTTDAFLALGDANSDLDEDVIIGAVINGEERCERLKAMRWDSLRFEIEFGVKF